MTDRLRHLSFATLPLVLVGLLFTAVSGLAVGPATGPKIKQATGSEDVPNLMGKDIGGTAKQKENQAPARKPIVR